MQHEWSVSAGSVGVRGGGAGADAGAGAAGEWDDETQ